MSGRYRLTRQAEQDAVDIWLHIAADNIHAADQLVDEFTAVFEQLAEFPIAGTSMDQYRPGLRCFSIAQLPHFLYGGG